MRLAAVGDVHGRADKLQALLADSRLADRMLVFLGDLVNRGPDSRVVLDCVCGLVAAGRAQALLGNHDRSFLRYLATGDFLPFAVAGGLPTIRSYVSEARGDVYRQVLGAVPTSHVRLLEGAALCWEDSNVVLSHAGISPMEPWRRDETVLVHGTGARLFIERATLPKLCVCGHYVQDGGKPYVSDTLICVDTGCGVGGPLTALLLPERQLVQV